MNGFPVVDPIPLPAPVWLFKALHMLTLALHFISVEMLLGGLLLAVCLNWLGHFKNGRDSALRINASAFLARRLPLVMTYVINLGVPPLLFAQVLYGRALYTSSVLVGLWWIAVIVLLMGCYWHVYRFAAAAESGKPAWLKGLVAWILAAVIAKIYTSNMTLMLRPEVWRDMYAASASGTRLPSGDPTLLPRWLFMMTGGLAVAGLWAVWLAGKKSLEEPVRKYLAAAGGRLALAMILIHAGAAFLVFRAQPDGVKAGLMNHSFYQAAGICWIAGAALVFLTGCWSGFARPANAAAGWLALLAGFAAMASAAVYRDGIRDVTLAGKGFDVWTREVATNWPIVGLFFVTFVLGVAGLGWLVSVMMRAKPVSEKVAS